MNLMSNERQSCVPTQATPGCQPRPGKAEHVRPRRHVRSVRRDTDHAPPAVADSELPARLTVDEVATYILRTSTKAVYAAAERGQLPGVIRIGRRLLFQRDALLDWLDQKRAPSPKESRR